MPFGFQRLNERSQRPNALINFIKSDPHTSEQDQKIAHDFLSRIAAQAYPIMKEHYISVMALEEYPPNPEFLGRNFNAGECIQLVLKDKGGRWLSFKFVQMVMMHELAHCKQMNHSRFFWNVRNEYAKMMEGLWAKKYLGEGMWGRGQNLASGAYTERMPENVQIPEHLCGGTYRRARGRKRKRGQEDAKERPKETYAERQQKKIARKFGKHGEGTALGDDELVRGALDRASGKRSTGKPRVAKSKRGRELRANAALARFDAMKHQRATALEQTSELEDDEGSETESGWSSDDDMDSSESIILRKKAGPQVKDGHGHELVRVCGDEGEDEDGGQDEMDELRMLSGKPKDFPERAVPTEKKTETRSDGLPNPWPTVADERSETEDEPDEDESGAAAAAPPPRESPAQAKTHSSGQGPSANSPHTTARPAQPDPPAPAFERVATAPQLAACPVCSLENEPNTVTCVACSHVLKPSLMRNNWRCRSDACNPGYMNPGDFGRCGLCGAQKPAAAASGGVGEVRGPGDVGNGRPVGLVGNDVLRWD